jgi:hypothetical protein
MPDTRSHGLDQSSSTNSGSVVTFAFRGHENDEYRCSEKHLTLMKQKPHRVPDRQGHNRLPAQHIWSGLQLLAFTCCWILRQAAAQLSRQAPTRRDRFGGPTPPLQHPNPAHGIVQFAAQHHHEQLLAASVNTRPTHSCSCDIVKQAARLSRPLIKRVSKGYNNAQRCATNTPALLQQNKQFHSPSMAVAGSQTVSAKDSYNGSNSPTRWRRRMQGSSRFMRRTPSSQRP